MRTHWVLGGHGSIHSPDHWVWHPSWTGRWYRALPDVQSCHSRPPSDAEVLSSDHDPLYRFEQWQANLRILEVAEIKTVPCVPLSHPFVERLIGTIRREYLDRTLFWTTVDLEKAAGVPGLLQQLSNPSLIGGENTRQEGTTTRGESDVRSMTTALSRLVPDTDSCVIVGRLRCRSGKVTV